MCVMLCLLYLPFTVSRLPVYHTSLLPFFYPQNFNLTYLSLYLMTMSLDDCSTLLGDKHVDTIVTMYNLSELLLVMGSDGKRE